MRNLGKNIGILIVLLHASTVAAVAAGGETVPSTDFFAGLPALLQSPQFLAGIFAGAAAAHLLHLLLHAGRRMLLHTVFLGQRTLHYGVAAALLGGLILLI
ncbi:MAG TPA: hypothetical protein VNK52_03870 [Hyphomicrobiaceae bacterium]|nr:hypothetical protein [Hyphomicrobiaceae bacterium]